MLLEFQERMITVEKCWVYAQKRDCVWVTYFKHRSLYKYTRVTKGQDRVEIRSMVDLVLVKRKSCNVRAVRGME